MKAVIPFEEPRIDAVRALKILDTQPEAPFDALARLACRLADAPVAMIGLCDGRRNWFKAVAGYCGVKELPAEAAFERCLGSLDTPVCVEDAYEDTRLKLHPFVLGAPFARGIAAIGIRLPGGPIVGSLVILDQKPRKFDPLVLNALEAVARSAGALLEARRTRYEAERVGLAMLVEEDEVFIVDGRSLTIRHANPKALESLHADESQVVGYPLPNFSADYASLSAADGAQRRSFPTTHLRADGSSYLVTASIFPLPDESPPAILVRAVSRPVEAGADADQLLLPESPGRLLACAPYEERIARAMGRNLANGELLGMILVEIDHLPEFRNRFGVEVANEALSVIAARLLRCVRPSDAVCRIGPNTFGLVFEDLGQPCYGELVARRIAKVLGEPVKAGGHVHHFVADLTLSFYRDEPVSAIDWIEAAARDLAKVQAAKRASLELAAARARRVSGLSAA